MVHGNVNPATLLVPNKDELRHPNISLAVESIRQLFGDKKVGDHSQSAFASIGELLGLSSTAFHLESCPKDDIESLLYVLVHFSSGGTIFSQEQLEKAETTDHNLLIFKRKQLA